MQRLVLVLGRRGGDRRLRRGQPRRHGATNHRAGRVRRAATVNTRTTSLGTVLTNSKGFTLYYFLPEKGSTLGACTGGA